MLKNVVEIACWIPVAYILLRGLGVTVSNVAKFLLAHIDFGD